MAPVSYSTSARSAFAPPTTDKIGTMSAMVPVYFSMIELKCSAVSEVKSGSL